jgi:hypothetical protein
MTSYENPTIQKNLILMDHFFREKPVAELLPVSKIICSTYRAPGERYLDELFDRFPIDFKETFTFSNDERDYNLKIKNQYSNKIHVRGLSLEFKTAIREIAGSILEKKTSEMKLAWRAIERGKLSWGL